MTSKGKKKGRWADRREASRQIDIYAKPPPPPSHTCRRRQHDARSPVLGPGDGAQHVLDPCQRRGHQVPLGVGRAVFF